MKACRTLRTRPSHLMRRSDSHSLLGCEMFAAGKRGGRTMTAPIVVPDAALIRSASPRSSSGSELATNGGGSAPERSSFSRAALRFDSSVSSNFVAIIAGQPIA